MKIALVILHAAPARGGAERYTLDLARALAERGHDVSVLASSFQTPDILARAVLLTSVGFTRTSRYQSFLNSLDRELARGNYAVVHAMLPVHRCDLYHPHAGIAGDIVLNGHRSKSGLVNKTLAWIGNRTNVRRLRFAAVEKQLLNSSRPPVVLCLSKLINRVLRSTYPDLPADNLVALFNGIDIHRFDPFTAGVTGQPVRERFGIHSDTVVGLMLAQDFERKGLRQAILAIARTPGVTLLVGGRANPDPYRELARSLGAGDRVIFAGHVDDAVSFYKAADFFVLPTRFDPCSLVVLEALAMGLPVISTVKNGACEIMQDGVHGRVLADADDIPGLVTAMQELMSSSRRAEMAAACLALRPVLSQESHLRQLEALYHSTAASQNSG